QLMLNDLQQDSREGFIDWIEVTRSELGDVDVGLFRHWLDPMIPFSETVLGPAHGVAITSATLRDNQLPDKEADEEAWHSARLISGVSHLPHPALVSAHKSPFEYARQARIFVVNDIARERPRTIAAAMAELMKASKGGALGLFTSIQRLKNTYPELETRLQAAGIPLHAQHLDKMSLQTLLQLFREDKTSCLIGTDAVRDGVDVPGDALQMIIYDRVPWPRPDMLFKARAAWQGRDSWTDRMTRMRLRQAFGRLIRRSDDRGVFVMLDSRLPTRLTTAFPPEVEVTRTGLADAIAQSRAFLEGG
ncbi:MAG: helicase C-terminal domain-containing protein, partial [Candidatus Puniceispirillaceae bacterium]